MTADFREAVRLRLLDALARFGADEALRDVPMDKDLRAAGLDSLGHFNFVLSLEQEFSFEIPEHQLTFARLGTLNGILDVLCENLAVDAS